MVLVSHNHGFVFLKTRKTGGTSVELALEPLCRPAGASVSEATPAIIGAEGVVGRRLTPLRGGARTRPAIDWRNHMPAAEIRDALGADVWRRYRRVTTVRDPFDAAVSRYHWQLARRGLPEAADFADTRAAFRDLVTGPSYESDHDLVHLDGAFAADRVIRFETLAADLAAVRRELAPDAAPAPLPHAKRTSDRRRRPVADYYDEASIAAVRRNGAWAIDRFGYPDRPDAGVNAHADPIEVQR